MSLKGELFCHLRVNSPLGSLLTDLLGNLLSAHRHRRVSATTLLFAKLEMNFQHDHRV